MAALTPMVERCGCANTLVVLSDGSLVADNTDTDGIIGPLGEVMSIKNSNVAMLGAGGAARAAAIGLLMEGSSCRRVQSIRRAGSGTG